MHIKDASGVDTLVAAGELLWLVTLFRRDESLHQDQDICLPTAAILAALGMFSVPAGEVQLNPRQLAVIAPGLEIPVGGSAFIGLVQGPTSSR